MQSRALFMYIKMTLLALVELPPHLMKIYQEHEGFFTSVLLNNWLATG